MLKELPHPDILHLQAAMGWLELGNHVEANEEVERIRPEWRPHPDVLVLRCQIYIKAKQWDYALAVAEGLTEGAPNDPRGWVWLCKTHYYMGRAQQMYDVATLKVGFFAEDAELHYDTACYGCLLGRLKEAEDFLKRAFELGDAKQLKLHALGDPDLEALWKAIGRYF